ncbi:MAG: RNA polymerase factor sigma-54 [Thermodesulfobacteriota bacterium]|nr:RNA polymerase factor sigma-54 [Thermodesulfobacteriota bacterium]
MALELKQHLKLAQQLIMTPQLQQAIKLLQFSRLELTEYISQELESNPLLEIDSAPTEDRTEDADEGLQKKWEAYLETYGQDNIPYYEDEERPSLEATASREEVISDHLLWQLRMGAFEEDERELGVFIIGNLDNNGFLAMNNQDICEATGAKIERVESVIKRIQSFDPPGIASRDLKECLRIQAMILDLEDSLVWQIIDTHLEDLQTKNYDKIAQELGADTQDVARAAEIIMNMEPRPARNYLDEPLAYVVPDVYVVKIEGEYAVVLNEEEIPSLNLSNGYQKMLSSQKTGQLAKNYLQERMNSAQWLIKSIRQRQSTLCKVTESIVRFQKPFLEKGISCLDPLVLRDVAEDVGMHESTISRVTSNKYVHTPRGTFELKFFFNSGISKNTGGFVASLSVKNEIEKIIKMEDTRHPLSDKAIASRLEEKGIRIARRTVAKYREIMGILPSNRRKKYY